MENISVMIVSYTYKKGVDDLIFRVSRPLETILDYGINSRIQQ